MKNIRLFAVSALAVIALILGIVPVMAGESANTIGNLDEDYTSIRNSAVEYEYPGMITKAGEALVFSLTASDPDNDVLVFSASNLPPGATFDTLTGTFSWTPGYDQAGTYTNIHFEVSDGVLTDSEDITITVIDSNLPPVLDLITDKSIAVLNSLEFSVTATDPEGDALTYSASNLPPGASFNTQTGIFSWTPDISQLGEYQGMRFQVSDGKLTDFQEITITVTDGIIADSLPEEAVCSITSLSINPTKVNPYKKVNIRVTASNSGTASGTYEIVLQINGIVEESRQVVIAPGTSITESFTVIKSEAGDYIVDVNGLSATFTINETDKTPLKKI